MLAASVSQWCQTNLLSLWIWMTIIPSLQPCRKIHEIQSAGVNCATQLVVNLSSTVLDLTCSQSTRLLTNAPLVVFRGRNKIHYIPSWMVLFVRLFHSTKEGDVVTLFVRLATSVVTLHWLLPRSRASKGTHRDSTFVDLHVFTMYLCFYACTYTSMYVHRNKCKCTCKYTVRMSSRIYECIYVWLYHVCM